MMNEQIRDNENYLKAHVDATTAIHGMATGVAPVGSKQLATPRIEYKSVSAAYGVGNNTATVSWTNEFAHVYACGFMPVVTARTGANTSLTSWLPVALGNNSLSTTGASITFVIGGDGGSTVTITWYFWAIGD